MSRRPQKPKESKPWDRFPWPGQGDSNLDVLYASVGRALSEWEHLESVLGYLFAAFVGAPPYKAAIRAYCAVRTFEGRAEMLRASSEAYFAATPHDEHLSRYKEILTEAKQFSERRHDLAHGVVDHYRQQAPAGHLMLPYPGQYALFPSYSTFRNRNLAGFPAYCYTSAEIDVYRIGFYLLRRKAASLSSDIVNEERQRASFGKLRKLYRTSASQSDPNNSQQEPAPPPDS